MFKFRSGTHGLNEELGRHRGREGAKECVLCDAECDSVSHVLWECPAYSSGREAFMSKLKAALGDGFKHFELLDSFGRSSFVLGSDTWEEHSTSLLSLIKNFILDVWELGKLMLYGEDDKHSQNASGVHGVAGGSGKLGCLSGKADTITSVCIGSAQHVGCVVYGQSARAAT